MNPSTNKITTLLTSRERSSRMYAPPRFEVIASIAPTRPSSPPLAPSERLPINELTRNPNAPVKMYRKKYREEP